MNRTAKEIKQEAGRVLLGALASVRVLIEKIKANERSMRVIRFGLRYALVCLVIVLYTIVVYRVAYKNALKTYEGWMDDYKAQQIAQAEEATRNAPVDPYEAQLDAEAELLARVLYGVKDNKTDDLKTYCWCVFNRVDNPAFPATLEEVIEQPEVHVAIYDKEELFNNCVVQVLTNTVTGDVSVGWWPAWEAHP